MERLRRKPLTPLETQPSPRHRRNTDILQPAVEDIAVRMEHTSSRKRSLQAVVPIDALSLNQLVLVLGNKGFRWKICDFSVLEDRAVLCYPLRSRGERKTSSVSQGEIAPFSPSSWSAVFRKKNSGVLSSADGKQEEMDTLPKSVSGVKHAKALQVYLEVDGKEEILSSAELQFIDENDHVVEAYAMRCIEDVFSGDLESNVFEISLREKQDEFVTKLYSKLYRIHMGNSNDVADITHLIQNFIDDSAESFNASSTKGFLAKLANDTLCFHLGKASCDALPGSPKYLWLVRGRLLFFKKHESLRPCFILSTTSDFYVSLGDTDESFILVSEQTKYVCSTSSEVDRDLWISAITFEAQMRNAVSPFVQPSELEILRRKQTGSVTERNANHLEERPKGGRKFDEISPRSSGIFRDEDDEDLDDMAALMEEVEYNDSLKDDDNAGGVKGESAIKLCSKLRRQNHFFKFVYDNLRKRTALFNTNVFSEEVFRLRFEKSLFNRSKSIIKSILEMLSSYYEFFEKTSLILSHCLILSHDSSNSSSANQICFSFPGFDTVTINVGSYSIIDAYKISQNSQNPCCWSKSQWKNALGSAHSVGKELMQCICDVAELYDRGEVDLAKQLTMSTNTELLRNLLIASYCYLHFKEISSGELKRFSMEDMAHVIDSSSQNYGRLTQLCGGCAFWVNPSIDDVCKLLSHKDLEILKKVMCICTPLHWLHLVRFVMTNRLGRIRLIESALQTYFARSGKKLIGKRMTVFLEEFRETVEEEIKSLALVLSTMPTVGSMLSAMEEEQLKINEFMRSAKFETLKEMVIHLDLSLLSKLEDVDEEEKIPEEENSSAHSTE